MANSIAEDTYVIGVDVGTGSVRAGIFDMTGSLLSSAKKNITLYRESGAIAEQSANEIWDVVCQVVRSAVNEAAVEPKQIAGIGFDATCSLVVVEQDGSPLAVQKGGEPERNIIVWMDHRAIEQAERINATGHEVLKYVGGQISPEMETPKLLWLKEHHPETFNRAGHFFDLTDYLTWRSTGDNARSVCTVTCKWTYLAHERRWDADYFRTVGLEELTDNNFQRIGSNVVDTATALGSGLSETAAEALGLSVGTPVAAGLIDAHAGGVGTVGAPGSVGTLTSRMAYIFGTSACSMVTTEKPVFVNGVWGPYFSAMFPGFWLNEGGQSAAGSAIDHLVKLHPETQVAQKMAQQVGLSLVTWLSQEAERKCNSGLSIFDVMGQLHVLPEFLGNRSPHAEPEARAIIAGLDMDTGIDSLIGLYVAGLCGLGYGVRQLTEALRESGVMIDTLVISGGAGQSDFVRQVLADTSGLNIATPQTAEPVLLGSAILGAVASGCYKDIASAMQAMSRFGPVLNPMRGDTAKAHDRRYLAFCKMQKLDRELREMV